MTPDTDDHESERLSAETTAALPSELDELIEPSPASAEDAVAGLEALPREAALLIVKRGPNAGARFLLDRNLTSVGRHPESDIFLDDITVSRRHAEFRRAEGDFHICDTGSLNGTYVNHRPIDTAVLANGDEIQIGKFRLVFLTAPDSLTRH